MTHSILAGGVNIFDGCESGEAVPPDVDSQGVARRHTDVDTQVKLETVNQQRLNTPIKQIIFGDILKLRSLGTFEMYC